MDTPTNTSSKWEVLPPAYGALDASQEAEILEFVRSASAKLVAAEKNIAYVRYVVSLMAIAFLVVIIIGILMSRK